MSVEPVRAYWCYGLSTAGKAVLWAATEMLSLYFLTDMARMDPRLAGALFFAFMLCNAVCDPLIGGYWDRRQSLPSRGYYRLGISLTALLFVLTFCVVGNGIVRLGFAIASGLALRASFAAIDVPHNAMLSRLVAAGCSSVRLSAVRFLAATIASLFAVSAAGQMLSAPGPSSRFTVFAIGLAVIGAALFLVFLPKLSSTIEAVPAPQPSAQAYGQGHQLFIASALVMGGGITAVIGGIYSKSAVYIAKDLFSDPSWAATALGVFLSGRLISIVFIFLRRAEWMMALLLPLSLATAAGSVLLLLPPSQTTYLVALFVLGATLGSVNILSWALLPRMASDLRLAGFAFPEAFLFGCFTSLTKLGLALSGLILGWILAPLGLAQAARSGAGTYAACGYISLAGSLIAAAAFAVIVLWQSASWWNAGFTTPRQASPAD